MREKLSVVCRAAFFVCMAALAILAWLPATEMTRTSLGGHAEHMVAWLGTAIVTGLAWPAKPRLFTQCVLLIGYAAVLEAGQVYCPGRHASVEDFAFSLAGVVIGSLFLSVARTRVVNWLKH